MDNDTFASTVKDLFNVTTNDNALAKIKEVVSTNAESANAGAQSAGLQKDLNKLLEALGVGNVGDALTEIANLKK
eukprot:CAMPEP_0168535380 /NCGR_PEP_ID=MMETSP0405-20121227/18639_1 /TAXON_ID=498012 /ORGANISM="Trichosphaerium sp, Strain Am-I-7 wt" /LENGTH=74 /DNA_ID=CAMNT_0008562623 /DNA_START=17 /DNA_END=241 /DNA_ORIENTATION=-